MSYLNFNKDELVNLEYSLSREILSTNRAGGYMSTTIVCCNTRKYHGLLVCPIEKFDGENYVLLSSLDETIIQHEQKFNLGIHRYPGVYNPKGHKYIIDFEFEPTPTLTYRVGGVILSKAILIIHKTSQIMIKYTLIDAHSPTVLRLKPFLAFRNQHKLSKSNSYINTKNENIDNGITSNLYEGFPTLNMQISKQNNFNSVPNWFYNIEYLEEKERGYDFSEDLFTPGDFDIPMEKGESIIFSASLKEIKSSALLNDFDKELAMRFPKNNFLNCLKNSANQFIIRRGKDTEIMAGYPWFGRWGRDTFIALPGLTLSANYNLETCKAVLDTMSREMNNGLFPNIGKNKKAAYNSVDAPMWYFWAIQKYANEVNDKKLIWENYGKKMKSILRTFQIGSDNISMHKNGLIWSEEKGKALTWMDAVVDGVPVTPRAGYAVEINALWYNSIKFMLDLAIDNNDMSFVEEWKYLPTKIAKSFVKVFWNEKEEYLADYVDNNGQNMDFRSNQVIATSLEYSPIDNKKKELILKAVKKELLTPKGLRTLSPENAQYKGICKGDQATRDLAYHQGTVWVWQLSHYVEGNFRIHKNKFCKDAEKIISNFEEDLTTYGICGIAEIYDGNPPYNPGGSISQAWSVSEILRIIKMTEEYKNK